MFTDRADEAIAGFCDIHWPVLTDLGNCRVARCRYDKHLRSYAPE